MKVGTIAGLYPLDRVETRLRNYYINTAGEVFSTQLTTEPRKMQGTRAANGVRYYTLNRCSYAGSALLQRARANKDFASETETVSMPVAAWPSPSQVASVVATRAGASDPVTPRSHAASVAQGIASRGVVLATVQDGKMIFGSDPKIHMNEQSYRDEMARLANANPGKKVVALKIIGAVEAASLLWS